MANENAMTVKDIREVLAKLPDDATFRPVWAEGPPGDDAPAIVVWGFRAGTVEGEPVLEVLVGLIPLDELEGEDE